MGDRPKARARVRHPLIGGIDDEEEVIDAQFEEPKERETYVGRVWDEERMAPVPDPPDEPPVAFNGKPLAEAEQEPMSFGTIARVAAARILRKASEILDP